MNVGDTIKCNNPDEAVEVMNELARGGVETDFVYEMNGEKGIWLIVTKARDK